MTRWLLDTNVLSELRRPRPNPKVVSFVRSRPLSSLFVSVVSLAEIRFRIELVDDATRRRELMDWLTHRVRPMFEQRMLPLSEDVLVRWRLLVEDGRRIGHTFSQPDLMIAAAALQGGLSVATRDTSEFEAARAAVFNPWEFDDV